jgi:hypothetical protein
MDRIKKSYWYPPIFGLKLCPQEGALSLFLHPFSFALLYYTAAAVPGASPHLPNPQFTPKSSHPSLGAPALPYSAPELILRADNPPSAR